jgi:hypothetical protein
LAYNTATKISSREITESCGNHWVLQRGKLCKQRHGNFDRRKKKIWCVLTCLGYRWELQRQWDILANKGNGNYAYIDNIQSQSLLSKNSKGSMFAIAKDVK